MEWSVSKGLLTKDKDFSGIARFEPLDGWMDGDGGRKYFSLKTFHFVSKDFYFNYPLLYPTSGDGDLPSTLLFYFVPPWLGILLPYY